MSEHIDKTITSLQEKIKELDGEIVKVKKTINQLLDLDGRLPLYTDADLQVSASGFGINVRRDEFYNKPLATCARMILERRQSANLGAASLDELYEALISGGYDPENKNEGIAKRNVAITLAKNPAFNRLPNETWGMREWYGLKAPKKSKENDKVTTDAGSQENPDEGDT
jgi:hypothetical protein